MDWLEWILVGPWLVMYTVAFGLLAVGAIILGCKAVWLLITGFKDDD